MNEREVREREKFRPLSKKIPHFRLHFSRLISIRIHIHVHIHIHIAKSEYKREGNNKATFVCHLNNVAKFTRSTRAKCNYDDAAAARCYS